ncbi:MAG: His/Gly/Thr/Pro-type tRNA ligase C-terminal domain-containing protein, partial [Oceanicaulis sp.]
VTAVVAKLRRLGLHARMSYKTTRNPGKLLKDAAACRARFAVMLGDEAQGGVAAVKHLDTGEQRDVPLDDLVNHLAGGA